MTEILYEDFYAAVERWQEVCSSQTMLECFIGTTVQAVAHGPITYHSSIGVRFDVPNEIGHNINLLLSPHYKTIIKAYLITQERPLSWK